MANIVANLGLTVSIDGRNAPRLLRAMIYTVRIWASIDRAVCRISRKTPLNLDITLSSKVNPNPEKQANNGHKGVVGGG